MKLLSVNVGRPRPNPWKGVKLTGIDKRPAAGPVMVTLPGAKGTGDVGLAGTGSTTCATMADRTRLCTPTPGKTSTSGPQNSADRCQTGYSART